MPIFLIPIVLLILYALERALFHKYWERGLSVSLDFAQEAVTEGDEAGLVEVITNRNFLPLHILQVSFQTDKGIMFGEDTNVSVSDRVNVADVFRSSCEIVIQSKHERVNHNIGIPRSMHFL